MYSSLQSFAFVLCFSKIGALVHWSLNTFSVQRNFPGFLVPTFFFSCSHVGMILQCNCVIVLNLFFGPPNIWQRLSVFVILVPSFHNSSTITILVFAGFPQHICALKYMVHRTDGPCLAPLVGFESFLVNGRFLSVRCRHVPQVQWMMPTSQYKAQSKQCNLEDVSQSSKISILPISVINSFDFSLKNSSVMSKSCINESRFGWFSKCWISLLTVSLRFVSSFWKVEWGVPGIL